ncbi:MAG: hypothetical protein WDO14_09110 [Bacteroidota bacterium]
MRTSLIHKSKPTVYKAVKTACNRLNLVIDRDDFEKGRISIYSEGDILSFGNKISISISKRGRDSFLRISSKSAAPIQLFDWGTNKDIEEDLMEEIKDILLK